MAAAAAITMGLNLAAQYAPEVILLIKHIRQKDGTTMTVATVITKLDTGDADFEDNLSADVAWFKAHNMTATGDPIAPAAPVPPAVPNSTGSVVIPPTT